MEDKKVAILMSTYNGEKYIKEQLDSLLNQTYKNIDIYIRDDESKDSTVEIIENYMKSVNNIKLIKGKNLGFVKSFFVLLKNVEEADYYAYCDQDDIWMEDKIQRVVEHLSKLDESKPNLYFSNSDYYDGEMNFVAHGDSKKVYNFRNSLVECVSQGMTMCINKKARDYIVDNIPQNCVFHDWWTYMICAGMGNIVYDEKPLVKYRRHTKSVTAEGKNFIELQMWRIRKFLQSDDLKKIKKQLIEFEAYFGKELKEEDKKVLNLFTNEKYSFSKAMEKTFYPKRFRKKLSDEILLRILFLIGKL